MIVSRMGFSVCVFLAVAGRSLGQDWIIGATQPNEIVLLTSDRTVNGDVFIMNNGRLQVRGATLTVHGDINVFGTATLDVADATIRFVQTFSYQRSLIAGDDATLKFTDTTIDTGGAFAYGVTMLANATAEFTRVTVPPEGGATWAFFENASLVMTDCVNGDEFVPIGTGSITISGTDGLIFWLALPDGSVVDTTIPPPGAVAAWSVGPNATWATGIPYSATLTNCTNVIWGVMGQSGCDGTFRDSTLRAVGSFFRRSNSISIQGIANNQFMNDTSYAWGDVHLRFVNSSVQSWNFYPFGTTQLTLDGCLFGELIASESGQAWVQSSLCDGSGGFVGVGENGQLVFILSTNLAQTTVSENGLLLSFRSALLNPLTNATDNAIVQLLNTESVGDPAAHDAATIFDVAVDPVQTEAGAPVTLRGTARMIAGPQSSFAFTGYTLEYGAGSQPSVWTPIGGPWANEVRDAPLGTWDTCGNLPGPYSVRVSLMHSLGAPATATSEVTLLDVLGVGRGTGDFNCDDVVDESDLPVFVSVLLGSNADPADAWIADMDGNLVADGNDVQPFLAALLGA